MKCNTTDESRRLEHVTVTLWNYIYELTWYDKLCSLIITLYNRKEQVMSKSQNTKKDSKKKPAKTMKEKKAEKREKKNEKSKTTNE